MQLGASADRFPRSQLKFALCTLLTGLSLCVLLVDILIVREQEGYGFLKLIRYLYRVYTTLVEERGYLLSHLPGDVARGRFDRGTGLLRT